MNLKNKNPKFKLTLLVTIAIVIAGAVGFYFIQKNTDTKEEGVLAKPAIFSFTAEKAPGWYRSPLDASTKEGRKSLLIFDHDMSTPPKSGDTQSCHVSAFLNQGVIDIDKKRQEIEGNTFGGRTTALVDTLNLTLSNDSGAEKYNLYRYKSTGGTEKYKDGNAYGYIQDGNYYVEVQVVCDTFEMLDSATSVLKAVQYNKSISKNDLF